MSAQRDDGERGRLEQPAAQFRAELAEQHRGREHRRQGASADFQRSGSETKPILTSPAFAAAAITCATFS